MNKNTLFKASFISMAILALSGCASTGHKDFSCPETNGVLCKSVSEIYEMTNSDNPATYQSSSKNELNEQNDGGMFKGGSRNKVEKAKTQEAMNVFSKPAYMPHSNPVPVLEQPKVLRVWIASWVDENDTLNFPSYKFKEITPRKWNFGGSQVFRNSLPVTAPDNSGDFQSPNQEIQSKAAVPNPNGLNDSLNKQHQMVGSSGMSTSSFHNDQSPNGLPVNGN